MVLLAVPGPLHLFDHLHDSLDLAFRGVPRHGKQQPLFRAVAQLVQVLLQVVIDNVDGGFFFWFVAEELPNRNPKICGDFIECFTLWRKSTFFPGGRSGFT